MDFQIHYILNCLLDNFTLMFLNKLAQSFNILFVSPHRQGKEIPWPRCKSTIIQMSICHNKTFSPLFSHPQKIGI